MLELTKRTSGVVSRSMFLNTVRYLLICLTALVLPFSPLQGQQITSPNYAPWNGFLGMVNILELINQDNTPQNVTITVHNIDGTPGTPVHRTIAPKGQWDEILHNLSGFSQDSYGLVKIEFSGNLTGRTAFYRFEAGNPYDLDFAFAIPFVNATTGISHVGFNTFQPSHDPSDAPLIVDNWLSIVNLHTTQSQTFRIDSYDQAGNRFGERTVTLSPQSRQDVDGGHGLGANRVGFHTITPLTQGNLPYFAQLVRYGNSARGINFAFPLLSVPAGGTKQWVPVSRVKQSANWIEITNTSGSATTANVEIIANTGEVVHNENYSLPAYGQMHIPASEYLPAELSGSASVTTGTVGRLLVQSMFYFYNPYGGIAGMYGAQSESLRTGECSGSWNRFWSMDNHLRIFNTRDTDATFTVSVETNSKVHEENMSLPPKSGMDVSLLNWGTVPDFYGSVTVFGEGIVSDVIRFKPKTNGQLDFGLRTTMTCGPSSRSLRLDLSGAVGLALEDQSATGRSKGLARQGSKSNLKKVRGDGSLTEAVTRGQINVSNFLIAPNDRVYLHFPNPIDLGNPTNYGTCILAEVDTTTGIPKCIEDSPFSSISWGSRNDAIQFDGDGNIYYLLHLQSGGMALRRNTGSTIEDLINDNIFIERFLVLDDGRVIIYGHTSSSSLRWVRRVAAEGGIKNLYLSATAVFIHKFPDDNVYLGISGSSTISSGGVARYLPDSDMIDPQMYIGYRTEHPTSIHDLAPFCGGPLFSEYPGFCGSNGTIVIKGIHQTWDDHVYVIAGYSPDAELMRYYPDLHRPSTIVRKIFTFQSIGENLVLAGLDVDNKNVMTLFRTIDESEIQLIGPDNEIEIYNINYVSAENKIMFDGLRFSDNKYVIGQMNMNTMQVTASPVGTSKLVSFQTF